MSAKEAMDLCGSSSRRRRSTSSPKVGCVWESRMVVDEQNTKKSCSTMNGAVILEDKKVDSVGAKQGLIGVNGKRKGCKSESFEGTPPKRSELGKHLDGHCKELGGSCNGIKKSLVQIKKTRLVKGSGDQSSDGSEMSSSQLRRVKSDSGNGSRSEVRKMMSETSKNLDHHGSLKNSLQLVKAATLPRMIGDENSDKSDEKRVVDGSGKDLGEPVIRTEESVVGIMNSKSIQECKEVKAITSNGEDEEEEDEEEEDEEVEMKDLVIKDINISVEDQKPKKVMINERSAPISPLIEKQIPAANHAKIHPISDNSHGTPSKLQSLVDLIMWRDVSRSAFVFGIGAFAIISSSYTRDLNISFISVVSYLGLVYLGITFTFKSLTNRGNVYMENINQEYVVGEEEAIWLVKLVLPYVNEFLVKLRTLFSGDPPTTMKLAVVLFIMARCGGSMTIWKITKLGFFGVFMVPKLFSSYYSHLAALGSFWIRRFEDAWRSCSHKKAVGFGIFTLAWNQSSVVVRIWGVFLLLVAFKYYVHIKHQPSNYISNSRSTKLPKE